MGIVLTRDFGSDFLIPPHRGPRTRIWVHTNSQKLCLITNGYVRKPVVVGQERFSDFSATSWGLNLEYSEVCAYLKQSTTLLCTTRSSWSVIEAPTARLIPAWGEAPRQGPSRHHLPQSKG
ncbi:MAG TPA: hypothetical protein PLW35_14900 [Verrucomicrobiota bacterium]|nr:hypothetical protein [Verrucomicrobiota bacterium]